MSEFHCKIVSCDKIFFEGECVSMTIPTTDGEYAFLANHQNCIAALTDGSIRIRTADEQERIGVCSTGMVVFTDNKATVVADTIERPEDIDAVRAREAKERAEEDMKEAQSLADFKTSQAALARAMNRLRGHDRYIGGRYNG